jgi:hypothetical protein
MLAISCLLSIYEQLAKLLSVVINRAFMAVIFCFFKKMCYICFALHLVRALHIESVFAVLQENVEVFKNEGRTNNTHYLFVYGG